MGRQSTVRDKIFIRNSGNQRTGLEEEPSTMNFIITLWLKRPSFFIGAPQTKKFSSEEKESFQIHTTSGFEPENLVI